MVKLIPRSLSGAIEVATSSTCLTRLLIIVFERLARLDKLEIKSMSLDEQGNILFDDIIFNGEKLEVANNKEIDISVSFDNSEYINSYSITGKKDFNKNNKTILTLLKDGKKVKYNVIKKDEKYYKNHKEFLIPSDAIKLYERDVNDTFTIYLNDKKSARKTQTQRDLLNKSTIV